MICDKWLNCTLGKVAHCTNQKICIVYKDKRKNVSCKEKSKIYTLLNDIPCVITLYHVDGGIFYNDASTLKCDYMLYVDDKKDPTVLLIELKGKNLLHALKQIDNTDKKITGNFAGRKYARVVCSAVPNLQNDPEVKRVRRSLQSRGINLKISSQSMQETYSSLA